MAFLTGVLYVAAAIVILLIMITIHELGHYIAGKILGFKINEFAIGMGKAIFKKTNPKTGEIFSIRLFPIGGYCAFAGDEAAAGEGQPRNAKKESDKKEGKSITRKTYSNNGDFNEMAPWKRLIVLFAGGFANFISAIFFAFLFLMIIGYSQVIVVTSFNPKTAGVDPNALKPGDEIVAFNGETFSFLMNEYSSVRDRNYIYKVDENGKPIGTVDVTFRRPSEGSELHTVTLIIDEYDVFDAHNTKIGTSYGTGISLSYEKDGKYYVNAYYEKMSVGEALLKCVGFCFELAWWLLAILWGMVSRGENLDGVAGITGTVAIMSKSLQINPVNLFMLLPLISINLGVFNLLPVPALDGARMVFVGIEWARGRPVNQDLEAKVHMVGLLILLGLMVVAELVFWLGDGKSVLGLFDLFSRWKM